MSPRDLTRGKTEVDIQCQTFVETDGDLTDYYCVPPDISEDQKVTQLVIRGLEDLTFVPARMDGAPVRVLMSFHVAIRCAEDSCTVESFANHGNHAKELGLDYIAPQPVLSGQAWYAGYEDKLEWIHGYMPSLSFRFNQLGWPMRSLIEVAVDAEGVAGRGCIRSMRLMGDDEEERNRKKLDETMRSIGETRFIPGFSDGQPVAMTFFERAVMKNAALLVSRPPRNHQFVRFTDRYFVRALANPTEAPELYCVR